MKKQKPKMKLKSTATFEKKVAMRFSKTRYYAATSKNRRLYDFIEKEKLRLSTPRSDVVDRIIEKYKDMGKEKTPKGLKILYNIFRKNLFLAEQARREEMGNDNDFSRFPRRTSITTPPVHTDICNIISKPEILLLAYRKIRGNTGFMSKSSFFDVEQLNNLNSDQKELVVNTKTPDGLSIKILELTSSLLKRGLYPWGISRRIYFKKPGSKPGDKLRPITISPFLDRIVQDAIRMVLDAIYEPWFMKINRSFGFRTKKGTKDAMVALSSYLTNDLHYAIEGDISGAYDNVNKQKLLDIVAKRIKDRKFMNLLKSRLDYIYEDKKGQVKEEKGIPQGGIDSPILWNIYMHEFEEFIHGPLQEKLDELNQRHGLTFKKPIRSKQYIWKSN